MIYEFKQVPISELGKIVTGKTPSSKLDGMYGDEILFVTPKDFSGVKYISRTERFLSQEGKNKLKNFVIPSGSIVVSCIGSDMGKAAIVTRDSVTNQQLNSIIVNNGDNPEYVYYLLLTMKSYLKNLASGGSTMPLLNKTEFSKINLNIPTERVVQDKSVTLLNSIDKKIEINERINFTLERIAQMLFKSWFVDFDPVHAKKLALEKGLNPAKAERAAMAIISGVCGPSDFAENFEEMDKKLSAKLSKMSKENQEELAHTASLFPSEFEDSENGETPKGWTPEPLGNYLEIKRGGSPRPIRDFIVEAGFPWTKIADATANNNPFIFKTKEFIKEEGLRKTVLLKEGSLILSNSATPGLPRFLALEACVHDGWLHFPKISHFSKSYLYFQFLKIREHLIQQGNGSVFTNLKTDIIRNQKVVIPNKEILDVFTAKSDLILKKIEFSSKESQKLEELRDTLLPKLLSGEIDLSGVCID